MALKAARRALFLALLLPLPALADDGFCAALRRVTEEARRSFAGLPEGGKIFAGSLREWREPQFAPHWEFEAAFNAILMEHGPTVARAPAARRFRELSREIPRCLPALRVLNRTQVPQQHGISWREPGVEVEMLLDRPAGAGMYQLQLSVMRLR